MTVGSAHLLELLDIQWPIIQAPMAGTGTPALAAAVSNAGGLGSLGVGTTNAEGARKLIAAFRALSARSVNVNVFCHQPAKLISAIFYHRDLGAKLSAIAYGRLHTRMRDESDDDELMNAVLLELQIQIGVGETTGTPMLLGNDFARLRLELAADLAAPRAVFEGLSQPGCLLNRRNVLPGLVVTWTVSMMHCEENL